MRALGLILILVFASACDKQHQLDCTHLDLQAVDRCAEANRTKGQAASLVACLPFSERLKTSGTWIVGFEKNDFFEGGEVPPPDRMWVESTGASLIVDEKVEQKIVPNGPQIQALQVEVV